MRLAATTAGPVEIDEDVKDTLSTVGNGKFDLNVTIKVDYDFYEQWLDSEGAKSGKE